jgi:hypothetical protein
LPLKEPLTSLLSLIHPPADRLFLGDPIYIARYSTQVKVTIISLSVNF